MKTLPILLLTMALSACASSLPPPTSDEEILARLKEIRGYKCDELVLKKQEYNALSSGGYDFHARSANMASAEINLRCKK
jgi:hypothetical protein